MNIEGNQLMALGVLKAFGLNAAELQKAQSAWPDLISRAQEAARAKAEADAKAKEAKAAHEASKSVPPAK